MSSDNTMRFLTALLFALLAPATAWSQFADSKIPRFTATALTGEKVSSAQLIGQPTVLIVTPSKEAAEDTRLWVQALRKNIDPKAIRIRDVLAIDLPFFMSESDAIGRAKEKIPARYFDQTWIFAEQELERALGIPTNSHKAFVVVLDSAGQVIARVEGNPTEARVEQVQSAVRSTKP
jgi:cytochrome oxidase Cu insertion factor (SCO1/SenC/PrrC family)